MIVKCYCGKELPKANKKYCCQKCYGLQNQGINNPFYGKKHSAETFAKIKNSTGYKNRKTNAGQKRTIQQKKNMTVPHHGMRGEKNHLYRKDFPYTGRGRIQILDWARQNNANPWDVADLWFSSCKICGWNKARCEIHHIVYKGLGGDASRENLITLCPNCHKLTHLKKITVDELKACQEE